MATGPKRRFRRVETTLFMRYRTSDMPAFKSVVTHDISGGGLQFVLDHKLPIDSKISMLINIPGKATPVEAAGVVRNYEQKNTVIEGREQVGFSIGIEFTRVGLDDRRLIIRYVQSVRNNILYLKKNWT